jgi:hypothetical protein
VEPRGSEPEPTRPPRADALDELGRQVTAVLRSANDEADRVRTDAQAEAEAMRAEARVQAAELHAEAAQDRDEAKRLLVRARERADQLVVDAEQAAAAVVSEADQSARTRVAAIMETGRVRLQRLHEEEQRGRDRLLAAQEELEAVIRRITRPVPVIDLTAPEPAVRLGMRPNTAPAPVELVAGEEPEIDSAAAGRPDPLAAMVQSAVSQAVAHSAERHPSGHNGDEPRPADGPRPEPPTAAPDASAE